MKNNLSLAIFIFATVYFQSTFANAETPSNPIKGALTSLDLVANLFSGKISGKYNALDQATFAKLSSDLFVFGVQKSSPLLTKFNNEDLVLSINAERDELAHSALWKKYTGIEQKSIVIPAIGISYGISKETLVNISYKQYKADGASLVGGTLRNTIPIPAASIEASIGISHSRLINNAPLQLETTSIDLVGVYTQKEIKPYVGIGIIHGHSEFRSTENMRFSGNLIKAFSGFEYFYNQLLISTELGLAGSQTYQNLSISYLF